MPGLYARVASGTLRLASPGSQRQSVSSKPNGASPRPARLLAGLWSAALLVILTFLVLYPTAMLLVGALTNLNPVVDGYHLEAISIASFIDVLANENVHYALGNTLIACAGGTAVAVVIGLFFAWIVVRTNTPWKGLIATAGMLPLFVPPLVAGVGWALLGSPKTGLINTFLARAGIDWRINLYSMSGIIFVFGMYYAPYVYMFTASALRNMDPSLEEAAEISGATPFRTIFTITFPLIAPAIISGMLLSFVVMLGIYGIPAVLGAPANIPVLTTYIFQLTAWTPPEYSKAAAVALILMVATGALVALQQKVLSGRSYTTVAGKAFRPRSLNLGPWRWLTFSLALVYLFVVVFLDIEHFAGCTEEAVDAPLRVIGRPRGDTGGPSFVKIFADNYPCRDHDGAAFIGGEDGLDGVGQHPVRFGLLGVRGHVPRVEPWRAFSRAQVGHPVVSRRASVVHAPQEGQRVIAG